MDPRRIQPDMLAIGLLQANRRIQPDMLAIGLQQVGGQGPAQHRQFLAQRGARLILGPV